MPLDIKLFTGSTNPDFAQGVASALGIELGDIIVDRFSDGEIRVEILENVRGREIFIVQSTCRPVNESLMELIVMADAFRRASAAKITAVVPYFGYARQDRRVRSSRVPITAKIVANMMDMVGINRMITVDLHADQIQGFFYNPVDNVYATQAMLNADGLAERYPGLVVVSPDVGGVVRARAVAKRLNDTDLAIIDKRRPAANQAEVMNVIGDVKGKDCLLVDDIVDTAGTLCQAADALKSAGANQVFACCTHPVLSGKAIEHIESSCLSEVIVSDTIPLSEAAQACDRIRVASLSPVIAETIQRVQSKKSIRSMFTD